VTLCSRCDAAISRSSPTLHRMFRPCSCFAGVSRWRAYFTCAFFLVGVLIEPEVVVEVDLSNDDKAQLRVDPIDQVRISNVPNKQKQTVGSLIQSAIAQVMFRHLRAHIMCRTHSLRQRYWLCSDIPASRQATGADLPCAIDTSIWRCSVTICSALNHFFGMTKTPF